MNLEQNLEQIVLQQDKIREKYFHDLVIQNTNIQSDLLSALDLPSDLSRLKLIHEDRYINGIIADFTLIYDNHIQAIIECKAGDIGVTDYVRGIGQVLQYEYFYENEISKYYPYKNGGFNSVLLIPSSVFLNKNFNIALFKYPITTKIIEINDVNNAVRLITQQELDNFKEQTKNNLISISQYYVRDTRLFEIYMLLRYLCFLKIKNTNEVNRREIELEMQKTNSINNRNWRNVWISLSSFGFINGHNMPTETGLKMGMLDVNQFLLIMYKSYVKPYADILMNYFVENPNHLNKGLQEIKQDFLDKYSGNEILFLTQSQTRYLSSWLNILRDDFGCLDFQARSSSRNLNYNPANLNDDFLLKEISKYTKANPYIANLQTIL
ncbi:hypothetical protein [Moraxella sp. ZY200743]|uniref:hypothetical protein n=1 Tax=Moraxella sp. ZY200743 TaxID=2911970 RepID=UPI003D7C96BD